jgi:hypothetical protein
MAMTRRGRPSATTAMRRRRKRKRVEMPGGGDAREGG